MAALTVASTVTAYIAKRDKRDARRAGRAVRSDASRRLSRYVLGQPQRGNKQLAVPAAPLAAIALAALSEADLKAWREASRRAQSDDGRPAGQRSEGRPQRCLRAHEGELSPALPEVIRRGLKAGRDEAEEAEEPSLGTTRY